MLQFNILHSTAWILYSRYLKNKWLGNNKKNQGGDYVTSNQGKVAIVTGGSSGIGRATAVGLAKDGGAKVVIAARREKEGNETVKLVKEAGGDGIFVRTDVTMEDDVRALVEKTVKEYGGA